MLYARLIAPFADVICIFAGDFNGLEGIASFLIRWIRMECPSTLPRTVRPRVVIVMGEETSPTHNILELGDLISKMTQETTVDKREDIFKTISIMDLPGDFVSPLARYRRLREVLMEQVEQARNVRIQERLLFSAVHFEAFFQQAVKHVSHSLTEPFDFIASTRKDNEIDSNYTNHIATFVALANQHFAPYQSLVTFLASSILMDAFPPGMHSKTVQSRHSIYSDVCRV